MNIYDTAGPDFLRILLAAELVAFTLAFMARLLILNYNDGSTSTSPPLDNYDAAFLNGGTKHMFLTALTALEHQGSVELNLAEKMVRTLPNGDPRISKRNPYSEQFLSPNTCTLKEKTEAHPHPVEMVVRGAIWHKDSRICDVFNVVKPTLDNIRERLIGMGLATTVSQEALARFIPFQFMMLPLIFLALPKYGIGVSHHKPVLFLMLISGICTIVAGIFLCKPAFRTLKGNEVLDKLKKHDPALKDNYKYSASTLQTKDLVFAYALFAPFAFTLLNPTKQNLASDSGSNLWSYKPAVSYSSCGSVSGCGGSGCGGGGCGGGCGGCGG